MAPSYILYVIYNMMLVNNYKNVIDTFFRRKVGEKTDAF